MRSILHAVGVLPLLLMSTLATPDLPIEKNGRSLTPAIESEPQISDVTITARDLFSRQSCSSTEEECSDGCCQSFSNCCHGKSCTPIGGECCSDGGSCDTGKKCCGDGCAPQLATCCGDGAYCTLAKGSCTKVDGKWMCEKYGSYDQASGLKSPAWGAIGGLVAAGVGAAGML